MKRAWTVIALILLFLPSSAGADTIYSWRDKNGVLRFSDQPPPQGITDYEITDSAPSSSMDSASDNQRRPSYDQMVQKAADEARRAGDQRQEQEAAEAREKERIAEEQRRARIQAEHKRLEQKIKEIENRAVSPTMPNGMKQAQIEALKKEIQKLEKGNASETEK